MVLEREREREREREPITGSHQVSEKMA